jgi:catechol 2,3-dioxygenase-like lactoylglutathione lyase family enzyme
MEPQLALITLGVPDLGAARRFYVDGLGWKPIFEVPGDIIFLQIGHGVALGLWSAAKLAEDMKATVVPSTPSPFSLAHIVATEADVADVLKRAEAAGATIVKPAQRADFGGVHGYFLDPAGFAWEIAYNSGWKVAPDGTVTVGAVED